MTAARPNEGRRRPTTRRGRWALLILGWLLIACHRAPSGPDGPWPPPDGWRLRSDRARSQERPPIRVESLSGLAFVWIPGGTFQYGCTLHGSEKQDGEACRAVTVAGFWLGRTEVTVSAYERCVAAGVCTAPHQTDNRDFTFECTWGRKSEDDFPVNCVDWKDATAFCGWIGGRLPTSEEWEYAAKGGADPIYPWGDEPPRPELVNSRPAVAPANGFEAGASKDGVLQMAGNLWEWTSTDYDGPYSHALKTGTPKVIRGGSWHRPSEWYRNAWKTGDEKEIWNDNGGLRCAR